LHQEKEAFITSDHGEKIKEKDQRTDPKGRKESGSREKEIQSHSILERIESDEKPRDKHNCMICSVDFLF